MKKPLRIGIVSIYPQSKEKHAYQGGVAAYTKNLVESLLASNKNFQIVILADRENNADIYYEHNKRVKIIRVWKPGWKFPHGIIKAVKKENLKIIHLHQEFRLYGKSYTSLIFLYLLLRLKMMGARTVVTIHGVLAQESITRQFVKENNTCLPVFLVRFGFSLIFRGIDKLANQIIVHELLLKKILVNDYGINSFKITVIFLGVEDRKPKISQEGARKSLEISKKRVILFFGYVTGYKSPELLLEAFADYSKFDIDTLLIIAGGKHPRMGNNRRYLEKYNNLEKLARMIPQDQIRWYGFVPERDIEKVIMASDLLIFPYTVAISASAVLAFALAYKKPFLVSEPMKEMLNSEEIVFRSDKENLAQKIKDFFGNKVSISKFIIKEREKRLWINVAEKTRALYKVMHNGF
jgi:glycosyltransferase involved in cell wall biosynthesis